MDGALNLGNRQSADGFLGGIAELGDAAVRFAFFCRISLDQYGVILEQNRSVVQGVVFQGTGAAVDVHTIVYACRYTACAQGKLRALGHRLPGSDGSRDRRSLGVVRTGAAGFRCLYREIGKVLVRIQSAVAVREQGGFLTDGCGGVGDSWSRTSAFKGISSAVADQINPCAGCIEQFYLAARAAHSNHRIAFGN
ncbi:hypothetical protein D3C75_902270 [compost metagenome]